MKLGGDKLTNLLMSIQIVAYMTLFKVDFPAELELYIKSLRKIAEFDILPTEQVKEWFHNNDLLG